MVDELLEATDKEFTTSFTVNSDNIFLERDSLNECALIENICQSSAAGLSYSRRNSQRRFKDGFLGSIKNLNLFSHPVVGDTLITNVCVEHEFENMFLISGRVYRNEVLLLECKVSLAAKF